MQDVFPRGERCCSHGRAAEGKTICVCACADELIKLATFFPPFLFLLSKMQKRRLLQIDKLLILFLRLSEQSGCSTEPSRRAHTLPAPPTRSLARLTQEILKTVCYFCLIIHLNRTSYTEPTRSAAYSL